MKFLLPILALTLALLSGCEDKPGRFPDTPAGRRQLVIYTLETEEVAAIPDTSDTKFFARTKDGTVWYVYAFRHEIHTKHPMLIERIIQSKLE